MNPASDELNRAVARLVAQVSHWTPSRWAAFSASGAPRAELVYALVQQIADLAADAGSEPRRTVPRLDNDLALTDQLRVVVADLGRAGPDGAVLRNTAALVAAARLTL